MDAVVGLVQSGVESVLFSEVVASIASFAAAEFDVEMVRPKMIAFASTTAAAVVAKVTFASSAHFVTLQAVVNLIL